MQESALISIIIPTYNRAHLIGETLDSIVTQAYKKWECIIVDDGSNDNTEKVVTDYILEDPRFKYYKRPSDQPKGANACRNYGFEVSKGEFIKFFDSDDLMHTDFLKHQFSLITTDSNIDFVACQGEVFSKSDDTFNKNMFKPKTINPKNVVLDYIYGHFFILTPSPLWRKSFLQGSYLFDKELLRCQEVDFHFRQILKKPNFIYEDKVYFYVRRGHNEIQNNSSKEFDLYKSRFIYFNRILTSTKNLSISTKDKQEVYKYVVNRILKIYYKLTISYEVSLKRLMITLSTISRSRINIWKKIKLILGVIMITITKKGYALIE